MSFSSKISWNEQRLLSGSHCSTSQAVLISQRSPLTAQKGSKTHSRAKPLDLQHVRHRRSDSLIPRMGIKWIESFSSKAEIPEERKADLEELLKNKTFCKQPVPWSPATPKGMPEEYEEYHNSPDYVTINVPPNFLFQSKIFQPSRLCALYRRSQ